MFSVMMYAVVDPSVVVVVGLGRCSGVGQKVGLRASPARQIRQSRVTNFSFPYPRAAPSAKGPNLAFPNIYFVQQFVCKTESS